MLLILKLFLFSNVTIYLKSVEHFANQTQNTYVGVATNNYHSPN